MSGFSDGRPCPVCNQIMNVSTDWKPVDSVSMFCPHCGFHGITELMLLSEEDRASFCEDYEEECVPLTLEQRQQFLKDFQEMFGPLSADAQAAYLGQPVSEKKKVLISVRGGVAYVDTCPEGVAVEIVDHDNVEAESAEARGHAH
jgi:hypothetical protein